MSYDKDLNFIFRFKTKIIFGPDTAKDVGMEVDSLGCSRALIVTDSYISSKTDLAERVKTALGKFCAGVFDGCEPDSGVHIVDKGTEMGRKVKADCLVSVGGGSSIDTAKGMAICLKKGGNLRDYPGINFLDAPITPHIVIPTTGGTGSEVTYAAVIKDHEAGRKLLICDNFLIPDIAILDPLMTVGMPPMVTAGTGMDAVTHAVEAIHSLQRDPIADALALHAIRLAKRYLPDAVKNGNDITARGQMLIAANMAGAAFSNAQVGVVHALAHSVGARFNVPHGVANSILLPHCIRFNLSECPDRYAMVAETLGVDIRGKSDEKAGAEAADAAMALAKSVGLPLRLRDVKVPESGLETAANDAISDGAIVYNPRNAMDHGLLLGILRQAW